MKGKGLIIAVIVLLLLVILPFFGSYNSLVALEEQVNNRWSQVENQLARRADLIPNLVETVKGYAAHESAIFTEIADARSRLLGAGSVAERMAAENELSSALSRLLAIAENYPTLKADANFRQLQDELAGTENRIAVARKDYNDAVTAYNTRIRRFPTVLVARLMGFEPKIYFEAPESAQQAPRVDFG
ncbi:MAG TPA: LemA family protein, partial [Clostridia bacterium]|nr:LemA family protein [Clostridia bacterium]